MQNKAGGNNRIVIKNSAYAIIGSAIGMPTAMLTSIVMGRILGVEGVGIYSFAMTLAATFFIFLNLGLSGIFQRDIAQNKSVASKYYANTLFLRFCIFIPLGLLIFVILSFALNRVDQIAIMLLSCLYIGLSGVFSIVIGGIAAFENFKVHSIFSIIEKLGILCATVVSLLVTRDLVAMLICYNAFFALLTFSALVYVNKFMCRIYLEADFKFCKHYIKEAVPQVLSAAAEYINLKSDLLVLSLLISNTATGLYSVASNIYIAASIIPVDIARAATPTFNRSLGENKDPRTMVRKIFLVMEGLALVLCIAVFLLARFGILLLWGDKFEGSVVLLQILAVSLLFMPLNRFFGYMLVGLKRQDVVAKCTWMATIVNLAGNFALVPIIGITAVAYTTIATELLVTLVEFVILQKQTHYFFG